jgi:acylphosphatase
LSGGPDVIRRRVVAYGRVQGVFFRAAIKQLAGQRGVSGSARNRGDGSVEAVFEGPGAAVEDMVAFCAEGPDQARVSRLDVVEEEPQGIAGFTAR